MDSAAINATGGTFGALRLSDNDTAQNSSAPAGVVSAFLNSTKGLDEFAVNAKPIVSEIMEALEKGVEISDLPHQNFDMNMFHWVVIAGDVDALKEMIKSAKQTSHEKFLEFINKPNDALSVERASYEGALGRQSPAINGDTPLGIALFVENKMKGREGFASTLMNHLMPGDIKIQNPDKDAINNKGNSLLNLAAGGCRKQDVERLCELMGESVMGGLINRQTDGGSTPLHHAATSGYGEVVEFLLAKGAGDSLSIIDKAGRTPLHSAALSGRREVLECLLNEEGAQGSLSLDDTKGCKPCDLLRQRLEKMEKSWGHLDKLEERSEADTVKMEGLRKEVDLWEELLVKLNPPPVATQTVPAGAIKI